MKILIDLPEVPEALGAAAREYCEDAVQSMLGCQAPDHELWGLVRTAKATVYKAKSRKAARPQGRKAAQQDGIWSVVLLRSKALLEMLEEPSKDVSAYIAIGVAAESAKHAVYKAWAKVARCDMPRRRKWTEAELAGYYTVCVVLKGAADVTLHSFQV